MMIFMANIYAVPLKRPSKRSQRIWRPIFIIIRISATPPYSPRKSAQPGPGWLLRGYCPFWRKEL